MSNRSAAPPRAVIWAAALLLALGPLFWWATRPAPPGQKGLSFRAVAFSELEGWAADDHGAALAAFLRSCERFEQWPGQRSLSGRGGIGGQAPTRKPDLARLGMRALLGGSLATFMTASIAGLLN